MAAKPLLWRARTVVPDPASSLDDGAVLVRDGRVAAVGRFADLRREGARVQDLGEAALLPGLVNAHCHLDLTGARGACRPTADFLGWIEGIRALRDRLRPGVAAAVEEGARELLADGCTLVADMGWEREGLAGLRRSGIRALAMMEVLGFPTVVRKPLGEALETLESLAPGDSVAPGLAPHSPYACSEDLLRRCAEAARVRRLPVSIHLAETPHEVAWLVEGGGGFEEPLRSLFGPGWRPPGKRPAEYLRSAGFLDEPRLLAHGNMLDAAEREIVRDAGCTVVHCPGSHAFFSHGRHPVADLRADGVTVAIGTDSLASHPDGVLSMPNEIRTLAAREPSIPPAELLAMATVNGAEGLGLAGRAGVLHPGAFADAAAFEVPGGWKGPESLLDPDLRCRFAFVGGALRHERKGP